MEYILIISCAFFQNVAFSMVSRSRNRNNQWYHGICAVFSNGLWFATAGVLVHNEWTFMLAIPYIMGTVAGSIYGMKVSIWIEKKIGAEM